MVEKKTTKRILRSCLTNGSIISLDIPGTKPSTDLFLPL